MNAIGSVLLDTSIVVAHFRHTSELTEKFRHSNLYLPLVALGELSYGAYHSQFQGKALLQIRQFLRACVVLLVDEATAEHYGELKAGLRRAGTPVPENDIWVAALAKEHQLPLATRDRHVTLVPGLTVLEW